MSVPPLIMANIVYNWTTLSFAQQGPVVQMIHYAYCPATTEAN